METFARWSKTILKRNLLLVYSVIWNDALLGKANEMRLEMVFFLKAGGGGGLVNKTLHQELFWGCVVQRTLVWFIVHWGFQYCWQRVEECLRSSYCENVHVVHILELFFGPYIRTIVNENDQSCFAFYFLFLISLSFFFLLFLCVGCFA